MSSGEAAVEMLPEVLDYLGEQRTLTLATASPSGVPHAGTFLYVHDGPELYFWTKAHTTTARHIEQNPLVSFTIDGYADDLQKVRGLQGGGECRVILSGEQDRARSRPLRAQSFPLLSPGTTMNDLLLPPDRGQRAAVHRQHRRLDPPSRRQPSAWNSTASAPTRCSPTCLC